MNRKKGTQYEDQATLILTQSGLTLLERNVFSPFGEIDLIFKDKNCFVFVEVRYRKNIQFGTPEQTIHHKKQEKIIQTALYWMDKQNINSEMQEFRFDVFAVNETIYEWITNAFVQEV